MPRKHVRDRSARLPRAGQRPEPSPHPSKALPASTVARLLGELQDAQSSLARALALRGVTDTSIAGKLEFAKNYLAELTDWLD